MILLLISLLIPGPFTARAQTPSELLAIDASAQAREVTRTQAAQGHFPADRDEVTYVNPRTTDTACGSPLTVDEKIAQQNLREFPEYMKAQGVNPAPYVAVLGYEILSAPTIASLKLALGTPWVTVNLPTIYAIRDASWALEKKHFPPKKFSRASDEADALRHFAFTTLLTLEFGKEKALIILNGHEVYERDLGSLMDYYNNERALELVVPHLEDIRAMKPLRQEQALMEIFREALRDQKLVVLRPRLGNTPPVSTDFYRWAHQFLRRKLD
jgi:hypothetical protein